MNENRERPWLLDLATEQRGEPTIPEAAAYDDERQMTMLQEPHIPVIDSKHPPVTKKADREVGEDEKAAW